MYKYITKNWGIEALLMRYKEQQSAYESVRIKNDGTADKGKLVGRCGLLQSFIVTIIYADASLNKTKIRRGMG